MTEQEDPPVGCLVALAMLALPWVYLICRWGWRMMTWMFSPLNEIS